VPPTRSPSKPHCEQPGDDRDEHDERDRLLKDLQLRKAQPGEADAVGWDLQRVLEESDAPCDDDREEPWSMVEPAKVAVRKRNPATTRLPGRVLRRSAGATSSDLETPAT